MFPHSVYSSWRWAGTPAFHEDPDRLPMERRLHVLWHHQHLQRDRLETLRGVPLRVLHPGFYNRGPGPDFQQAVLCFGDSRPLTGDVEVDRLPRDWYAHGHHRNPAYANVKLHVVWLTSDAAEQELPTLELKAFLLEPLEVSTSRDLSEIPVLDASPGDCSPVLSAWDAAELRELLRQAALVRLESKAGSLGFRARQAGWDQALIEAMFAALGYRHNVWPMRLMAERLAPRFWGHPEPRMSVDQAQAWMLGLSGLLPEDLERKSPSTDAYVRGLWDVWWRERDAWAGEQLPRAVWRLGGMRPANHPHRRLALAAHWLAEAGLVQGLEAWFLTSQDSHRARQALRDLLSPSDEFWLWHCSLHSPRAPKPTALLGASRLGDLAMNVLLPWFWIRARAGKADSLQRRAERLYLTWPRGEDNALLRITRRRVLNLSKDTVCRTAAEQQGLLQLAHDFCERSNPLCHCCPLPELARAARPVGGWPGSGAAPPEGPRSP